MDTEHPIYEVYVMWNTVDPMAEDQYMGGEKFLGKSVSSGTRKIQVAGPDALNRAMCVAESFHGDNNTRYDIEIHRLGLPLLALSNERWSALDDDRLDPFIESELMSRYLEEMPVLF